MSPPPGEAGDLVGIARQIFEERIPFHRWLGLQVLAVDTAESRVAVGHRPELVGNFVRGSLHGGVLASLLDAVGGLAAFQALFERVEGVSETEAAATLSGLGTIDLRVDYLRAARGERFEAVGRVLRAGSRVAVCRMECVADDGKAVAAGTGTYILG